MRPICESQRLETLADVYGPPRGGGPFGGQLCPGAQFAVEAQRLRAGAHALGGAGLAERAGGAGRAQFDGLRKRQPLPGGAEHAGAVGVARVHGTLDVAPRQFQAGHFHVGVVFVQAEDSRERFAAIMGYIDENFRRKLLLGEIARREGLTMPYLSHLFKDTLGMSFQEYLKKRRFEYARSLLLDTRKSLLDISLESGFSDARYMIRMFAEEFGCSPREYRRKNASWEAAEGGARDTAQTILGVDDAIRVLQTAREEFGLCTREL